MSKAQFVLARELIKEKDYEAARALLVTIEHPLAADWLARLERIAPTQASDSPSTAEESSEAFAVDMPSLDDLVRLEPPTAKPAAPKRAQPQPEPAILDYATPVDAEVAPVAPNAIPAPAPINHAAFRRPGTADAAPAPGMPEAPGPNNGQARSAATKSKPPPAKGASAKPASGRPMAATPSTRLQSATPIQPTGKPAWQGWASWLLFGTPPPGQEAQDRLQTGPPVDDRTPRDDDEAVDWRSLPSRANSGQSSEMPWLSGKIDARGSSYYGRVATMGAAPAARGPAGDALEWDFSGELPPPTPQAEDDDPPRLRAEQEAGERGKKHGHRLFDGLNLIFVGLFSCGVFAFIYSTRQAATPAGEAYAVGSEAAFVVIGLLLVLLGLWRIIGPEQARADEAKAARPTP